MAAVINIGDNDYIGTLKAVASIANGVFVKADYAAGTAAATASTAEGDAAGLLFVNNVNINIDQQTVGDDTFAVANGEYLRLKALETGDIFTTDQFVPAIGSINVNDVLAAAAAGKLDAIGARTPKLSVKVIEKTTLFGNNAIKCVVLSV
ncbi:hypothetical protein [Paenibacillus cremeus]|uniref:DUF2190 family protein n=1 Tax=Paenibacillus cremeus TaxID=2163881 RepID=A0A559KCX1_9BACL|nr:hypothetical protein [Paenibacillus cremeus]TVY09963.1 hypothetical protein FPZ49_11370 [Paenibacillus cremeus]